MSLSPKAYLVAVLSLAVPCIMFANVAVWVERVGQCRALDDPGTYIAECDEPSYGDYEHGAFYYDLEPGLSEHLKRAQVLFVGSSQAQFGFSTEATRAFFERRGVPYYIMGFGYNEGAPFAADLIERYGLRPKLIVINAGYFVYPVSSEPARAVTSWSIKPLLEHELKHVALSISRAICPHATWLCPRDHGAVYRSVSDGRWVWEHVLADPDASEPILPSKIKVSEGQYDYFKDSIEAFLQRAGISAHCVVITASPNSDTDWSNVSEYIAAKLGMTAVLPRLPELTTVDGSHLNKVSAERWSAAVLDQVGPVLDRCLARQEAIRGPG